MTSRARSTFETRYEQMFPTLDAAEIDRLKPFGERRTYARGESLATTGYAPCGRALRRQVADRAPAPNLVPEETVDRSRRR